MPGNRAGRTVALVGAIVIAWTQTLFAQQAGEARGRLKVFCRGTPTPDTAGFRSVAPFAELMSDSAAADVILSIQRLPTLSRVRIIAIGNRSLRGRADTLTVSAADANSPTSVDSAFLSVAALSLIRFAMDSPVQGGVDVRFETEGTRVPTAVADRWSRWTFTLGMNVGLNGEQQTGTHDLSYQVGANRTTEKLRIDFLSNLQTTGSRYDIGGDRIRSSSRATTTTGLVVRRIGKHVGIGAMGSAGSSTQLNQKTATSGSLALEYNVFPYDDFSWRQLVLQYAVGYDRLSYLEETIYDKTEETRPRDARGASLQLRKGSGSLDLSVAHTRYLDDVKKQRLSTYGMVSSRILGGLSVHFGGGYSLIRDQIFLPKADVSLEDILLRRKQLETSFQYQIALGLSFNFGSKVPTAPNPRLAGIGGILMY
jgi:hypothetical protein